jgi:cellulose synthase/poly-beta-1,6-N-acetylglucosamine synthase-like glycosyltransferase
MIIFWLSFSLTAFYAILILVYLWGWLSIPYFQSLDITANHYHYTIIIPARNESAQIKNCITDILVQDYDNNKLQLLIIDDHSNDNTVEIVKEIIKENPSKHIKLISLSDDDLSHIRNKKEAITYAVENISSTYFILTDADCNRNTQWLATINKFVALKQPKFVYAPVQFSANNLFEAIQSFEFAGLVGIGASAIQIGYPNMCSAANLVVRTDTFKQIGGYLGNLHLASGDDEFLLHKVHKHFPNDVYFLKSKDAIVTTTPNASIKQLNSQRKRWVSKSLKYENRYITMILIMAYLFNLLILWNCITNPTLGLSMLMIKLIVEGLFLWPVLRFFRQQRYMLYLPLAEVCHILYVIVIGISANVGGYEWKNRKHE